MLLSMIGSVKSLYFCTGILYFVNLCDLHYIHLGISSILLVVISRHVGQALFLVFALYFLYYLLILV